MHADSTDAELTLLDGIADITCQADPSLPNVQAFYAIAPGLCVPAVVTSFNMIAGAPEQLSINA